MSTYHVTARRAEPRMWELEIDGVGTTQARRLSEAETRIREYIEIVTRGAAGNFEVDIRIDLGTMNHDIAAARASAEAAQRAIRNASRQLRAVVAELDRAGLNGMEIARVLKLSRQRVSQLLHDTDAA